MSEIKKRERRSTVEVGGEEAEENLLEENRNGSSTTARRKSGKSRKKSLGESLAGICKELYNAEYREFLSRDAKGWFKLAIFYFFFYTCLASFFILLLVLFFQIIDMKTPNYFYKESVMHYKGINPGLGFRPQVDIESELIKVDATDNKQNYQSLDLFLTKYERSKTKNFTAAHGKKYVYNYETHINGTPCSRDKHYGYLPNSVQPCVLLKLNRIYGWLPIHSAKMPANLTKANSTDKFVYVKCEGEYGTDRDNIKQIEYYSAYPNHEIGGIPFKYFPYRNQPGYLSPLVWVYFKNVSMNVLVNVECKAYAKNIDNKDRLNRRGMTKFSLFISPSSSSTSKP